MINTNISKVVWIVSYRFFNRWCIFLQVTTLSDITTACGKFFSHSAYHCRFNDTTLHYYQWPKQTQPYGYSRKLQKQAIKRAFPRHGLVLLQKLGHWTDRGRESWLWFNQPPTERLYWCHQGCWRMYILTSRVCATRQHTHYHYCTQSIYLPIYTHRAIIWQIDRRMVQLTGTTRIIREFRSTTKAHRQEEEYQNLRIQMLELFS